MAKTVALPSGPGADTSSFSDSIPDDTTFQIALWLEKFAIEKLNIEILILDF
jgi:hypothetical protein